MFLKSVVIDKFHCKKSYPYSQNISFPLYNTYTLHVIIVYLRSPYRYAEQMIKLEERLKLIFIHIFTLTKSPTLGQIGNNHFILCHINGRTFFSKELGVMCVNSGLAYSNALHVTSIRSLLPKFVHKT